LAYPHDTLRILSDTGPEYSALFKGLRSLIMNDTLGAKRWIESFQTARRAVPPSDVQVDALLPEAWLIAGAIGVDEAARWLDPTLKVLRLSPQVNFLDPVRAAALVRAMALRAELASRAGDHETAALWGRAVAELWANCDPQLRPLRDRMRKLTS